MKNKLFESILNYFNQNNSENIAANNITEDSINNIPFDDNSYIEDVLNSEEGVTLALGHEACKTQIQY